MASWFYASEGKQQGPYPEGQFRDLIAQGIVRPDTLVWTEGMAGWQKAAEIPGLMSGGSAPPRMPAGGHPMMGGAGYGSGGGALSADFPTFALLGRSLLLVIGQILVIPAPWTATGFYRWAASRIHVPGRPDLAFTGQPLDIWYVFVLLGLMTYSGMAHSQIVSLISLVLQGFLGWLLFRWVISRLSSNDQPLAITFKGSPLTYVGWQILAFLAAITIIGWAWVLTAWMRWICRNIEGTRREVTFNASGLEMLWRTIVLMVGFALLIPIPWVLRWYASWIVSQFALVDRVAAAARAY